MPHSLLSRTAIDSLIQRALSEDAASRDATSRAVIPATTRIRARLLAKAPGVLAGGPLAAQVFRVVDPSLHCKLRARDGATLIRGQTIVTVEGRARSIFAAERTALNLLGHLSGIATLTRRYVEAVRGSRAQVFDTRKTLPGLRLLEKYAVQLGGGQNHRANLADAVLIKTNHLRAIRNQQSAISTGLATAVEKARKRTRRKFVEVEVTNLRELKAALAARPDAILLDNWRVTDIRKAVKLRNALPRPAGRNRRGGHASRFTKLEVSGGVTLANVRAIAKTGADRISVGRLTHSAPSLDVSLKVLS